MQARRGRKGTQPSRFVRERGATSSHACSTGLCEWIQGWTVEEGSRKLHGARDDVCRGPPERPIAEMDGIGSAEAQTFY